MEKTPYYLAYESRYQKVYAAGVKRWGHSPDDDVLLPTLSKWVDENRLAGKKVIEFACGEGAGGEILSKLGCIYHGVDIAPTAVKKSREALIHYPQASVSLLDMVNNPIPDKYDAAIDLMGYHMLILDTDRIKYLKNAFSCLKDNAPMLFFGNQPAFTIFQEPDCILLLNLREILLCPKNHFPSFYFCMS